MSNKSIIIDVSHTVEHGMTTYKGLPAPIISDHLSREESRKNYQPGTEFHIGKIEMVANTGTYLDSPFHRYPDGKDLADLDLNKLANVDGIVVRCLNTRRREIDVAAFKNHEVRGRAVVVHTGWDSHWRTEQYSNGEHPYLTEAAAEYLVEHGALLVGIDSYNIDDTQTGSRPAHSVLLKNDVPIVEHLCRLAELPDTGFHFFAVPVKVRSFGTFPVRAFGIVQV
jgi:arylformamidase